MIDWQVVKSLFFTQINQVHTLNFVMILIHIGKVAIPKQRCLSTEISHLHEPDGSAILISIFNLCPFLFPKIMSPIVLTTHQHSLKYVLFLSLQILSLVCFSLYGRRSAQNKQCHSWIMVGGLRGGGGKISYVKGFPNIHQDCPTRQFMWNADWTTSWWVG